METIPQKELRNNVGVVLRRVETGEAFTVTVSGRPVAELHPVGRQRWVSGPALARIWQGPTPVDLDRDLRDIGDIVTDPFET